MYSMKVAVTGDHAGRRSNTGNRRQPEIEEQQKVEIREEDHDDQREYGAGDREEDAARDCDRGQITDHSQITPRITLDPTKKTRIH